MDHAKYHAIRDAATAAYASGDTTALSAMIESGDMLYQTTDWSTWENADWTVFGIMTGLKIAQPDVQGRAFLATREAKLCASILGDKARVHEIAQLVWKDVN